MWESIFKIETLKEAILTAICVVLLCCFIFSIKSCQTASNELTEANNKISSLLTENMSLKDAISVQNTSISELNQKTAIAIAKSEAEMKAAKEKNKALEKRIADIKKTQVVNCEDTAPVVANVIEALKDFR
jgi:septal ring factor EnvC (AmiA/AmiB activator)